MRRSDYLKIFGIIAVGLGTALLLYPFLHELGHTLAIIATGGEILEFHLFPLPNVLCELKEYTAFNTIIVGFSGMMLPFLVSAIPNHKNFWVWLSNLYLKSISLLSFLISTAVVVLYQCGIPIQNDDMTKVMDAYPKAGCVYVLILLALSIFTIWQMITDNPLKHILSYFDLPYKESFAGGEKSEEY